MTSPEDPSSQRIEVRSAILSDTQQIWDIQKRYLYDSLDSQSRMKGFVRIELSLAEIESLVFVDEVAVAVRKDSVAGYFLTLGCLKNLESTAYLRHQAMSCRYQDVPVVNYETCYGAQICIHEAYRGCGLGSLLLRHTVRQLKGKYRLLMSSISKENSVGISHNIKKMNWIIIGEDDTRFYVIYDLHLTGGGSK